MGSYGNNITISMPGDDWQMLWPDDFSNFQLDIVGFLAILGEQSILANAQVAALSSFFYLPRLLPAPQALLRVSRPSTLRTSPATSVYSIQSGNKTSHLHHVANILLETAPGDLEKYSVRCVKITRSTEHGQPKPQTLLDRIFRGQPKQKKIEKNDNSDDSDDNDDNDDNDDSKNSYQDSAVKARAAGPLTWVTLLSVLLTLTIIVTSFCLGDGMSLMAAILLSLLSTVVGIANKWELEFAKLPKDTSDHTDQDSVVIQYPNGAFVVVKSDEQIRRELFFAPEEIKYTVKSALLYRVLALIGSVLLMFGVILLANARLELQLAWAASYIILNAAYWAAAAVPAKLHWDLSYYNVVEEGVHYAPDKVEEKGVRYVPKVDERGPHSENFTTALWKVILLTKESRWARYSGTAPNTPIWDEWLRQAADAASRAITSEKEEDLISPVRAWHSKGRGFVHHSPRDFHPKLAYNDLAEADRAKRPLQRAHTVGIPSSLDRQAVAGARPHSMAHGNDMV